MLLMTFSSCAKLPNVIGDNGLTYPAFLLYEIEVKKSHTPPPGEVASKTEPYFSDLDIEIKESVDLICKKAEEIIQYFDLLVHSFEVSEQDDYRVYNPIEISGEDNLTNDIDNIDSVIEKIEKAFIDLTKMLNEREKIVNEVFREGNNFINSERSISSDSIKSLKSREIITTSFNKAEKVLLVLTKRILVDCDKNIKSLEKHRANIAEMLLKLTKMYETITTDMPNLLEEYQKEQEKLFEDLVRIYKGLSNDLEILVERNWNDRKFAYLLSNGNKMLSDRFMKKSEQRVLQTLHE